VASNQFGCIYVFLIKEFAMRDPSRIPKLLTLVYEVWKENPDLRLGQLIVNAVRPSEPVPQIFYLEDDQMEVRLNELLHLMRGSRNQSDSVE